MATSLNERKLKPVKLREEIDLVPSPIYVESLHKCTNQLHTVITATNIYGFTLKTKDTL